METILIIAPLGFLGKLREELFAAFSNKVSGSNELIIQDGDSRVYISENVYIHNELGEAEAKRYTSRVPCPMFITLDFSDIELCKQVLLVAADYPDILVDNDHGLVVSGEWFVGLIRSNRQWDWRNEPPPAVLRINSSRGGSGDEGTIE